MHGPWFCFSHWNSLVSLEQLRRGSELIRECSSALVFTLQALIAVWVVRLFLRLFFCSSVILLTAEQPGMLDQRTRSLTHIDVGSNFVLAAKCFFIKKFLWMGMVAFNVRFSYGQAEFLPEHHQSWYRIEASYWRRQMSGPHKVGSIPGISKVNFCILDLNKKAVVYIQDPSQISFAGVTRWCWCRSDLPGPHMGFRKTSLPYTILQVGHQIVLSARVLIV